MNMLLDALDPCKAADVSTSRDIVSFSINILLYRVDVFVLTTCSLVHLEKLLVSQLVKKRPAVYGTRMLISVFTRFRHRPLF